MLLWCEYGGWGPTYQQKMELKIYWERPHPPEQGLAYPTASPSHQEASTSLLSSSIRGQTEWKPQSQIVIKLITWTTALSNSMKLWAMLGRPTQDGWVMMKSYKNVVHWRRRLPQMTSAFLPWEPHEQYEKKKKIWHRKMRPPGW